LQQYYWIHGNYYNALLLQCLYNHSQNSGCNRATLKKMIHTVQFPLTVSYDYLWNEIHIHSKIVLKMPFKVCTLFTYICLPGKNETNIPSIYFQALQFELNSLIVFQNLLQYTVVHNVMAANYGLHSKMLGSFLGLLKWGMHIPLGMTAKVQGIHLLDKLWLEWIFICTKKKFQNMTCKKKKLYRKFKLYVSNFLNLKPLADLKINSQWDVLLFHGYTYLTISWLYTSLTEEDKFPGERTPLETASLKNADALLIVSGLWICFRFNDR